MKAIERPRTDIQGSVVNGREWEVTFDQNVPAIHEWTDIHWTHSFAYPPSSTNLHIIGATTVKVGRLVDRKGEREHTYATYYLVVVRGCG